MEQEIAKALQKGAKPEEVAQALVQDGMSEQEAVQAVQTVMDQMGGGQPQGQRQGPRDGSGPGNPEGEQGITADQAIQVFGEMGVDPTSVLQIIKVVLNMNPQELEKLIGMISNGQEQQAAQEQEAQGNPEEQY